MTDQLREAFDRSLEEGERRMKRPWAELIATGTVGGIDIGIGVLALLAVLAHTHSEVLGSLFFGIGFVALTLASSELFTENFLVPVAAIVAGRATVLQLVRLWVTTFVTNLAGGWVIMAVVIGALPEVRPEAVRLGTHFASLGIGWQSFAAAVAGGTVITLMTWMERSTESVGGKLVAAVSAAFLLAIGPLDHAIVVSLEMFAGLQAGAPYGYLDWLGAVAWASLGNVIGGVGLVTVLRLVQVGPRNVRESADEAQADAEQHEHEEQQEQQERAAGGSEREPND